MNRFPNPLYSLSEAPAALRWAVTLFLATLGIAYAFGVLMVTTWVGLAPAQVAAAYREPETAVELDEAQVEERAISLEEVLGGKMEHRIDRRLLIQDTHVHVPVYALIAFALAAIALGLRWPSGVETALVFALFAGPALDFAGQWLTKLVADGFAYMTLAGGWLMAASYLAVAGTALWQMWISKIRRTHP